MVIEHQLLEKYEEAFRKKIIALKQMGYKTEPAFAKLLDLEGDPYLVLARKVQFLRYALSENSYLQK